MKLSVLVPVYNLESFIEQCLVSLLEQETKFDFEVIVVDDASTDKSWSIIKKLEESWPGLKVFKNDENSGLASTQKRLLDEAVGDYIAYLDGDDLALPLKLQIQVDYLDNNQDCNLCFHESDMFDSDTGNHIKLFTREFYNFKYIKQVGSCEDIILYGCFINASSIMFRRHSRMQEAIDDGCKIILDYPWHILNLLLNPGTVDYIPSTLGKYRIHNNSFGALTRKSSERREQSLSDLLRACKNAEAFGIDSGVVAKGRSHHFYSAALYFLRQGDIGRFNDLLEKSIQEVSEIFPLWYFDDKHQFAWDNKENHEKLCKAFFGD